MAYFSFRAVLLIGSLDDPNVWTTCHRTGHSRRTGASEQHCYAPEAYSAIECNQEAVRGRTAPAGLRPCPHTLLQASFWYMAWCCCTIFLCLWIHSSPTSFLACSDLPAKARTGRRADALRGDRDVGASIHEDVSARPVPLHLALSRLSKDGHFNAWGQTGAGWGLTHKQRGRGSGGEALTCVWSARCSACCS